MTLPACVLAQSTELNFADFNNQSLYNNFSGDSGTFAVGPASITTAFDTNACHGTSGAGLRIDYAVPSGFCGVWNSLIGQDNFPKYALNFTNLYGSLKNSSGNPSRVENVRVLKFSFWAKGNGNGDFNHQVKVEFKGPREVVGSSVFTIPNLGDWTRYDFPVAAAGTNDLSRMKEVVFVIEDWRNTNRTSHFFIDGLSFTTDQAPAAAGQCSNDQLLDLISHRAFFYFLTFTDDLGLALDRSTFSDVVSVGAIGFQLTAYCIGHRRGWADKAELENRVITILQNLTNLPMGPENGTIRGGYRGFYYHFLSANNGTRINERAELSPYDTTLLMYGVLTCKEYFRTNRQIQALSQQLFDRVEWDWLIDRSPGINSNQFHLAWKPGPTPDGTFLGHVDGQTDEAFMMDILALGSRTHPATFATYAARSRVSSSYPSNSGNDFMVSWNGCLFNYFFASCWLNYQSRGRDLHPTGPRDLWENSRRAILADRQFCLDHAAPIAGGSDDYYATYGETAWGLTACDNLTAPGASGPSDYLAFGGLPTEENLRFGTKAPHAGTLAVYGAAGSINFAPKQAVAALRHYFDIPNLWNPLLGFGDAFSLDPHYVEPVFDINGNPRIHFAAYLNGPWINNMVMGVDVGPMLLAIENHRSQQIWNLTGRNPEVKAGLDRIFGAAPVPPTASSAGHDAPQQSANLRGRVGLGAAGNGIPTSTAPANWNLQPGGIQ